MFPSRSQFSSHQNHSDWSCCTYFCTYMQAHLKWLCALVPPLFLNEKIIAEGRKIICNAGNIVANTPDPENAHAKVYVCKACQGYQAHVPYRREPLTSIHAKQRHRVYAHDTAVALAPKNRSWKKWRVSQVHFEPERQQPTHNHSANLRWGTRANLRWGTRPGMLRF